MVVLFYDVRVSGCNIRCGFFFFQLKDIVNQGKLVSDEIIINLLSKRLEDGAAKGEVGFILDGFPRTVRQAVSMLLE